MFLLHLFVCLFIWELCHGVHVEVKGQPVEILSFFQVCLEMKLKNRYLWAILFISENSLWELSVQVHVLCYYYESGVTYELLRTPVLECSLSFIVHSHFRGKQPSSVIVTCSASCPLLIYLPCSLSLRSPMTGAFLLVPLLRSCVLLVQYHWSLWSNFEIHPSSLTSHCGFLSINCALLKFSQGIS